MEITLNEEAEDLGLTFEDIKYGTSFILTESYCKLKRGESIDSIKTVWIKNTDTGAFGLNSRFSPFSPDTKVTCVKVISISIERDLT